MFRRVSEGRLDCIQHLPSPGAGFSIILVRNEYEGLMMDTYWGPPGWKRRD
jgi:hypothetical protein